jgi:tRNA pseudouridine55 synthase
MAVKQEKLILYKNRGETPLECLKRFKKDNPEYEKEKMTYAGRLDPLAEGLLLVLVGDECKNKDKYLGMDKTYEVDVLFGFATDTYDVLGKVTSGHCEGAEAIQKYFNTESGLLRDARNDLQDIIKSFVSRFSQKYPPFSSKTIKGKSLFSLFKSGELKDEEIPEKEVEIKDIKILDGKSIHKADLEKYIIESINLVKGDFRQEEILKNWKFATANFQFDNLMVVSLRIDCTSGTYMRSLANSIGEKIGIPALALSIKRVKVGEYTNLINVDRLGKE